MKMKQRCWIFSMMIAGFIAFFPNMAQAQPPFKVLVVMSYEQNMPWVQDIEKGINEVLKDSAEITYFYMDTKVNLKGGPEKAKQAFELYQQLQPHGVIVADDNAQSMFVVPYLKNKVKTPVMFCGVNADADKYGYPADNVSGILERQQNKQAIAFAQQFVPSIQTFSWMIKKSPVGEIILKQLRQEAHEYSAKLIDYKMPATKSEAISMAKSLAEKSDALLLSTLTGVVDDATGKTVGDEDLVPLVAKAFGKVVIGTEEQVVRAGALCSVLRTGEEQGRTAAKMLLKAMNGTPVSELKITRNHRGKRMLNVDVLKAMGIKPSPALLRGVELVKTR